MGRKGWIGRTTSLVLPIPPVRPAPPFEPAFQFSDPAGLEFTGLRAGPNVGPLESVVSRVR